MYELLKKYIPDDHSRQVNSEYYIDYIFQKEPKIKKVMDLGCGEGNSVDLFHKKNPGIKWVGVDIESSPEVKSRTRTDVEFITYDGIHIPFDNNHFDLIYCRQVFEHVRYPQKLMKEIHRVLKPGGYLIGSTSQLEPFHSYSIWNYTPYGFYLLLKGAGLQLVELRPGIDSFTLICRRYLGRPGFFTKWWEKESPFNLISSFFGKAKRTSPKFVNGNKLLFCGQFCFLVRKPKETAGKKKNKL